MMRATSLLCLVLLTLPAGAALPGAAYVTGRVDPATGCAPVALGDACLAWSASGPGGRRHVLADHGRVYALGAQGYDTQQIDARDAATGALLWTRTFADMADGYRIAASPDGSRLYAALTSLGYQGRFFSLDTATGATAWVVPAAVTEVIPTSTGVLATRAETTNTDLESRDFATGALVWSAPLVERIGSPHRDGVLSADGATLFLFHEQAAAYATVDGKLLWARPMGAYVAAFVLDESHGQIITALNPWHNSTLVSLDASTGALRWASPSHNILALVLQGDALVAAESQRVSGYSALDGSLRWDTWLSANEPLNLYLTCNDAVGGGGVAFVACGDGIFAYEAATGRALWTHSETVSHLAISDGALFASLSKNEGLNSRNAVQAYRVGPGLLHDVG